MKLLSDRPINSPLKLHARWCAVLISLLISFPLYAEKSQHQAAVVNVGLETEAAKSVIAFHRALKEGGTAAARQLLADDVSIYEGKGVERSADEYAAHHMQGDMAFLKEMTLTVVEHQVNVFGDVAYSVAKTRVQGEYKSKVIDRVGVETMVLIKVGKAWKIVHIHWS